MYQYVANRRNKNLVAYYSKDRHRWVNEDYLFSITLKGTELEFFEEFYRDAEMNSPRTAWGKERKLGNKEDLMNKGERIPMEMLDAAAADTNPSRGYEMSIIAKIDAQRGRYEDDDIRPGVVRDEYGIYQCAKFVPELRKSIRASFLELTDALTWINYQDWYYGRRAR